MTDLRSIFLGMSPGLTRAIEKAGSMGKLARLLGISQQAVSQWREVPTRHIIAIEHATGVPREVLRPDLYRRRRRRTTAVGSAPVVGADRREKPS